MAEQDKSFNEDFIGGTRIMTEFKAMRITIERRMYIGRDKVDPNSLYHAEDEKGRALGLIVHGLLDMDNILMVSKNKDGVGAMPFPQDFRALDYGSPYYINLKGNLIDTKA